MTRKCLSSKIFLGPFASDFTVLQKTQPLPSRLAFLNAVSSRPISGGSSGSAISCECAWRSDVPAAAP